MTNSSEANKLQCVPLKLKHTRSEISNLGKKLILGKPAVALKFMHCIPPLGALNINYPRRTGISTRSQLGSVRTPADTMPILPVLSLGRRPLPVCSNIERSGRGFLLQVASCRTPPLSSGPTWGRRKLSL